MSFLIDTNVISEVRKGSAANPTVMRWWESIRENELFLSVLVLGEIRRGIEKIRPTQRNKAEMLENWLNFLTSTFSGKLLPIDLETANVWGSIGIDRTLPLIDSLLAATAVANNLTLVTRNTADMEHCGVRLLNPFVE